jgi:hypothetical protein
LAEQYYDQLAAINEAVANREERPYPTKEEAGIIKTLSATIKQIGKRQTLSEVMEVFIDFELEVMRTDKDFAQKMIFYMDKYIHTLADFDNEKYNKKYLWNRRNDEEYVSYLKEQEELSKPEPGEKRGENGGFSEANGATPTRENPLISQVKVPNNGVKMGPSVEQHNPPKPAPQATNQNNANVNSEEKNQKGGIQERFQIPVKETKNTPLIITNCVGEYSICIRNFEGRRALTMTSNQPEERVDVSRLPSARYTVTILDADGNYYKHEVIIRN